jgi:large subunit ribosomal protein L4
MRIDIYSAAGEKKDQMELAPAIFEAPINRGLMHQAMVMQFANMRRPIAHAKRRSEVAGSTKKVYQQKHTGRARRGPIRSPLLKGGGKSFGPRKENNFSKDMPKAMRRAALLSCLSMQAKKGAMLGIEGYPDTIKTKDAQNLLKKLPVDLGRRILIVLAGKHRGLELSARNIPGVQTLLYSYLNPRDVLQARHIVFMTEALGKTEEWLSKKETKETKESKETNEKEVKEKRAPVKRKKISTPKA